MLKKSRILVTGGAGFIGSAVIRRLQKLGYRRIAVFDNFSTGLAENIPSGCLAVRGDLRNKKDLGKLPRGIECVFHLAAATSVEESFKRPEFYYENNVFGMINLLEWAGRQKVKKVVYASSGAVYGSVADGVVMRENLLPNPNNPYGLTKLDGEHLLIMQNLNHGMPYAIMRYFNVFGEGQECTSPYASVIPKFIYAALKGRDLTVYGTGDQTRDFVHVDDVAAATVTAMRKGNGIYNVATGKQHDVNSVARSILEALPARSRIVYMPPVPGDSSRDLGYNMRIRRLGWNVSRSFEQRLAETIRWYRARWHRENA